MTYRHLAVVGAAMIGLASSPALAAPSDTSLSAAAAAEIMNGDCLGFKGYAMTAAPHLKWDPALVVDKATEVLRSNMPWDKIQKLTRDAEAMAARGNKWEQDIAQFQVCLLNNKTAYAAAREKAAKK